MNKAWVKAALVRSAKTFCQTLAGTLTAATVLNEVDWLAALSASTLAAVYSLLTSMGGLPEVQ